MFHLPRTHPYHIRVSSIFYNCLYGCAITGFQMLVWNFVHWFGTNANIFCRYIESIGGCVSYFFWKIFPLTNVRFHKFGLANDRAQGSLDWYEPTKCHLKQLDTYNWVWSLWPREYILFTFPHFPYCVLQHSPLALWVPQRGVYTYWDMDAIELIWWARNTETIFGAVRDVYVQIKLALSKQYSDWWLSKYFPLACMI